MLDTIRPDLHQAQGAGAFMNIWQAAGLRRNELRNAAVLTWLLNPKGSHGLGDKMAKALFSQLREKPAWMPSASDLHDIAVVAEECPLGSEESRVDISITAPEFLLFIEVKIDAPLRDRQIERYLQEIGLKSTSLGNLPSLVIFLTPHGRKPAVGLDVASLSWVDVARAIGEIVKILPGADTRVPMLSQFAEHVRSF